MQLNLIDISAQYYGLEFSMSTKLLKEDIDFRYHPNVIVVVDCKNCFKIESMKTLKNQISQFISDLKQNQVNEIMLAWNQQLIDLFTLDYQSIKTLLQQLKSDTDELNHEYQINYKKTLVTVRHAIQNFKKKLEPQNQLVVVIFSSSYLTQEILVQGADEYSWSKWLFNYNLNKQNIDEQINHLKKVLNGISNNSVIHTIGFGHYHDMNLLNRMRYVGKSSGIYQYAQSFTQLNKILQGVVVKICDIIKLTYLIDIDKQGILQKKDNKNIISGQLDLNQQEFTNYYVIFIQKQLGNNILIGKINKMEYFDNKGKKYNLDVTISKIMIENQTDYFKYTIKYMQFLCNMLIQKIPTVVTIVRQKDQKGKYIYVPVYNQQKIKLFQDQKKQAQFEIQFLYEKAQQLKMSQRSMYIQQIISLKNQILTVQQTFANIFKGQVSHQKFAKLVCSIDFYSLKNGLKKKLLKRINSNPYMINQCFEKIKQILKTYDYIELDNKYAYLKSQIGNCVYKDHNFVKSLFKQDCLAISFEIQRPNTAIADPGQIVVKQVALQVISATQFLMNVQCQSVLKSATGMKQKVVQNWDYSYQKATTIGIMPLFICQQNWEIAKLLMKPCLGWTVTGQPLAYTFSQMQMIPFLVLAKIIDSRQLMKYDIDNKIQKAVDFHLKDAVIDQKTKKIIKPEIVQHEFYQIQHEKNQLLKKFERMKLMQKAVLQTCIRIIKDTSTQKFQNPFSKEIISKYQNYKYPIKRTVDIIPNNYAFIIQIYCLIQMKILEKPSEQQFHQFFKRLVEEQLRRQTYGWKQQYIQDKFINKLLNVQIQKMQAPVVIVLESDYRQKFYASEQGQTLIMLQIQEKKNHLQMQIKKEDKYNDVQKMALVQYKRLYEVKALWFWYVRFLIYEQKPRIYIHKWKCIDMLNSYNLFCLIIQNKLQRRNATRREAIMNEQYVDPFDYYEARPYIENLFLNLRQKQQAKNYKYIQQKNLSNAAQAFALTQDPIEAAGALIGCSIGINITKYYQQLLQNKCPIIQLKLKMLLTGNYKKVSVLNHGWKMSKKKLNALRQKYPKQFLIYQFSF